MAPLDSFTAAYIECALWSTNADHLDPEGTGAAGALEDHFGVEDFAPESLASIREDCAAFIEHNASDLAAYCEGGRDLAQAGHDFWLTRNRHGAGFWDRGAGLVGESLADAARVYGESNIYAGDDGRLHVS